MLERRKFVVRSAALAAGVLAAPWVMAQTAGPVRIGLDGEFGLAESTSAQAIELGIRVALEQINGAGGVLGGRKLELLTRDHRSIPARGIRNIKDFAAMPDVVAVFGGRFSPVIMEQLPLLKSSQMPFLAVWSAADGIVDNGMRPNYIFRLSLRDSLAMAAMLKSLSQRGLDRAGLLLTNTSWGRSSLAAAEKYIAGGGAHRPRIAATAWYNWTEKSLIEKYQRLLAAGAQAIVLVANDDEAALLVREVAQLPPEERKPILSHWGITGGEFVRQAGPALQKVDLSVIQTFSFFNAEPNSLAPFMTTLNKVAGIKRIEDIKAPVGVAHAFDMTHILARALKLAGSTDRPAVRDALERVRDYRGLIRHYAQPFTSNRHEALDSSNLLLARYRNDGVLVPVSH